MTEKICGVGSRGQGSATPQKKKYWWGKNVNVIPSQWSQPPFPNTHKQSWTSSYTTGNIQFYFIFNFFLKKKKDNWDWWLNSKKWHETFLCIHIYINFCNRVGLVYYFMLAKLSPARYYIWILYFILLHFMSNTRLVLCSNANVMSCVNLSAENDQ